MHRRIHRVMATPLPPTAAISTIVSWAVAAATFAMPIGDILLTEVDAADREITTAARQLLSNMASAPLGLCGALPAACTGRRVRRAATHRSHRPTRLPAGRAPLSGQPQCRTPLRPASSSIGCVTQTLEHIHVSVCGAFYMCSWEMIEPLQFR